MKELKQKKKIEELFSVRGKKVLITGAGGLGKYLAEGFMENGAYVIFTNSSDKKVEKTKEELSRGKERSCSGYVLDQTDADAIEKCLDMVEEKEGDIDVLINTVGIEGRLYAQDYSPEEIRRIIDVTLTSAILITQAVGKRFMIPKKKGKIIHFGSVASKMCHSYLGMPYEAAKAGIEALVRSFAVDWAEYGINVNAISPTWVNTPMIQDLVESQKEYYDLVVGMHGFGRISDVSDYLGTAIYLASEASDYLSGQNIYVDGAYTAGKPIPYKYY